MLMCIVNLPECPVEGRQSFPAFGHKRPLPNSISINPFSELGEEFGKCSERSKAGRSKGLFLRSHFLGSGLETPIYPQDW